MGDLQWLISTHWTAFHKVDLVLTSSMAATDRWLLCYSYDRIIQIACVCCCVVQRPDEEVVVDQGGTSSAMNIHYEKEELEGEARLCFFFKATCFKYDKNILFPNVETVQTWPYVSRTHYINLRNHYIITWLFLKPLKRSRRSRLLGALTRCSSSPLSVQSGALLSAPLLPCAHLHSNYLHSSNLLSGRRKSVST